MQAIGHANNLKRTQKDVCCLGAGTVAVVRLLCSNGFERAHLAYSICGATGGTDSVAACGHSDFLRTSRGRHEACRPVLRPAFPLSRTISARAGGRFVALQAAVPTGGRRSKRRRRRMRRRIDATGRGSGDELPEELRRREQRLLAIREAKERLEAEQRRADDDRGRTPGSGRSWRGRKPYKWSYGEPDRKAQGNFTGPESWIIKTSAEGFQQCYNAQTVVDDSKQMVVAAAVGSGASDQGQMLPLLDSVAAGFGATPEEVLADADLLQRGGPVGT